MLSPPNLLVYFAEDLPGCLCVEESDDDPGVLPLEVGHRCGGVQQEALARGDVNALVLGSKFKVFQGLQWQQSAG